jgi:single-strand DNA-binding protein
MSKDLNQCNFIGRIGKDIELRYIPNGTAVVNTSIGCGDDYKDKQTGQKVEQTNWVNLAFFGRTAEVLSEYCRKGSKIFVSGKYKTTKWQGQDGTDKYKTEIVVSELILLDSRGSDASPRQDINQSSSQSQQPVGGDDFNDDIPFVCIKNAYLV